MKELCDLLLSIVPDSLPFGTIIMIGSLTQLQGEGLQGYANSGIRITRKLEGNFSGSTPIVFIPHLWAAAATLCWCGRLLTDAHGCLKCRVTRCKKP